jgi:hypothetical protein
VWLRPARAIFQSRSARFSREAIVRLSRSNDSRSVKAAIRQRRYFS